MALVTGDVETYKRTLVNRKHKTATQDTHLAPDSTGRSFPAAVGRSEGHGGSAGWGWRLLLLEGIKLGTLPQT